jgi:hypothetical protein
VAEKCIEGFDNADVFAGEQTNRGTRRLLVPRWRMIRAAKSWAYGGYSSPAMKAQDLRESRYGCEFAALRATGPDGDVGFAVPAAFLAAIRASTLAWLAWQTLT